MNMNDDKLMQQFFSGDRLYGDDLSLTEIEQWYIDEGEGYANLGAGEKDSYRYVYHALNQMHGFAGLDLRGVVSVLGFGSAYGEELQPVLSAAQHITIVDPSEAFVREYIGPVPCTYVKPVASGQLPFSDAQFDFVTALGVLHHVPNVSTVVREISRVMRPGAILLLREPVVSMGDWRVPRGGLTKHERGIPLELLRSMVRDAGLIVRRESLCVFPPFSGLVRRFHPAIYNSVFWTWVDAILSRAFRWNLTYHATSFWRKFRPTSIFFVLQKSDAVHGKDASSS
jgi:SAM-dependent methyltransferase